MSICLYGKDFTPSHYVTSNSNSVSGNIINTIGVLLDTALITNALYLFGFTLPLAGVIGLLTSSGTEPCSNYNGIFIKSVDVTPSHYINANDVEDSNFLTIAVNGTGKLADIALTCSLVLPVIKYSLIIATSGLIALSAAIATCHSDTFRETLCTKSDDGNSVICLGGALVLQHDSSSDM